MLSVGVSQSGQFGQISPLPQVASFGAQGMPATVIYDAAGNVADVRLGVVSADELRSLLADLSTWADAPGDDPP